MTLFMGMAEKIESESKHGCIFIGNKKTLFMGMAEKIESESKHG